MVQLLLYILTVTSLIISSTSVFNIVDYGAIGDNKTINTIPIQKTVMAAYDAGGGTVLVPKGVFLSGTIGLASNVYLQLEEDAILQASNNVDDYPEDWDYWVFVMTSNATYTGILGSGSIIGNMWGMIDYYDSNQNQLEPKSWANIHGCRGECRPRLIGFTDCDHVSISGVTWRDSADWTSVFRRVNNLLIDGITIRGSQIWPNNDGMDLESCVNVTVRNVDIAVGDDGIVFSSGNTNDLNTPWPEKVGHYTPVRNVLVENCRISSHSSAIKFEAVFQKEHGEITNITVNNITIFDSARGIGVQQRIGSGDIHGITISNVLIETHFVIGSNWWGKGEPIWLTSVPGVANVTFGKFYDVQFFNISAHSENGVFISGRPYTLTNISFHNFSLLIDKWSNSSSPQHDYRPSIYDPPQNALVDGIYVEYADNLTFNDTLVTFSNNRQANWRTCLNAVDHVGVINKSDFVCNNPKKVTNLSERSIPVQ